MCDLYYLQRTPVYMDLNRMRELMKYNQKMKEKWITANLNKAYNQLTDGQQNKEK